VKILFILAFAIIIAGCSKTENSDDYGSKVVGNYSSTDAADLSTLKVEVVDKNTLTFTMLTPDGSGDFDKRVFDQIKINADFTFVQESHSHGMVQTMANGDIYNFDCSGSGHFTNNAIYFQNTYLTYNGSR